MVCVEVSTLLFIYVQAGAWLLYPATAMLVMVFWNRKEKANATTDRTKGKQRKATKPQEQVSAMDRT